MTVGPTMKKFQLDLPRDAVASVFQRGSDLVLVLTNGEERIIRNVYEGAEQSAETQLVFEDGAVGTVPSMELGESISTSEVFSTKSGDTDMSDPMVFPATAAVTDFLSTEDGAAAAAAAGLLGLAVLALAGGDDNDGGRDPDAMNDVSTVGAGQTIEIDVLANDVNSQKVAGGEGLDLEIIVLRKTGLQRLSH